MSFLLPRRLSLLRAVMMTCGIVESFAAIAVILPHEWMESAYRSLKLGANLPTDPLTGYLARSASLLWAVHGLLVLFMARDLRRYLPLTHVLGWLTLLMGVSFVGIDWYEGLPIWWTASEGPIVVVMGLVYVVLSRDKTLHTSAS